MQGRQKEQEERVQGVFHALSSVVRETLGLGELEKIETAACRIIRKTEGVDVEWYKFGK